MEEYLGNGKKIREDKWSASIAVGSRGFVEAVKSILDGLGKGRRVKEIGEGYQNSKSRLYLMVTILGSKRTI